MPGWNTLATYSPTDPPVVLADVLQAVSSDLRTWGGNVDAATHLLTNLGGLRVNAGSTIGIGAASPEAQLHSVAGASDNSNVLVDVTNQTTYDPIVTFRRQSTAVWNVGMDANDLKFKIGTGSSMNNIRTGMLVTVQSDGKVGIGTSTPKTKLHVTGLPTYASNAAAIAGGLTAGAFYTDGSGNLKVTY